MNEDRESEKIQKIREYLLKSGYPLEIEIGNILRRNGWLVINQWPYLDNDKKVRTADILASKMNPSAKPGSFFLLIECKKSEKHSWVFHTQRKEGEILPLIGTLSDVLKKIMKPAMSEKLQELLTNASIGKILGVVDTRSSRLLDKLANLHTLNKDTKIGVFNVIPDSRDDFFEATQQINSAIEYLPEPMKDLIIFPIIIFDGEMYEFYEEAENMKILPINHIQHTLFGPNLEPYLVDVVSKSYFFDFLKTIETDIQILAEIAGYERQFMKEEKKA